MEEEEAKTYYKLVAKLNDSYFSIWEAATEYKIGVTLHQPARPGHKGGYYVYESPQQALRCYIPFHRGGNFIAPRTVLKVQAWGDFVIYDSGKLSFSYIKPVRDIGFPQGYRYTRSVRNAGSRAGVQAPLLRDREAVYTRNLQRREADSGQNNFERYFASRPDIIAEVALSAQLPLRGEERKAEEDEITDEQPRVRDRGGREGREGSQGVGRDPEIRGLFRAMVSRLESQI